jgi:hypothetical protein
LDSARFSRFIPTKDRIDQDFTCLEVLGFAGVSGAGLFGDELGAVFGYRPSAF